MTYAKFRERFAQRARIRVIDRVPSGSAVVLVLRPAVEPTSVRTIEAALALARRGVTMRIAKRTIEAVVDEGEALLEVPTVESMDAIDGELQAAGLKMSMLDREAVDVRAIRLSLGLSQEDFALRFNLDVAAVRDWERGAQQPDRASSAYSRVIARAPQDAAAAQETELVRG